MGSLDESLGRHTPGDQTANGADDRFVGPDLNGNARTHVEPAPAPFEIRRVDHQLGVDLILRGELDLATVPLLQEHLDRAVHRGAAVVIDLAGLGYIDSAGLEALLRAEQQLQDSDGQLALRGGSRAVYRVFELAGVDRHFEWSDGPTAQTAPELDREPGERTRS